MTDLIHFDDRLRRLEIGQERLEGKLDALLDDNHQRTTFLYGTDGQGGTIGALTKTLSDQAQRIAELGNIATQVKAIGVTVAAILSFLGAHMMGWIRLLNGGPRGQT